MSISAEDVKTLQSTKETVGGIFQYSKPVFKHPKLSGTISFPYYTYLINNVLYGILDVDGGLYFYIDGFIVDEPCTYHDGIRRHFMAWLG